MCVLNLSSRAVRAFKLWKWIVLHTLFDSQPQILKTSDWLMTVSVPTIIKTCLSTTRWLQSLSRAAIMVVLHWKWPGCEPSALIRGLITLPSHPLSTCSPLWLSLVSFLLSSLWIWVCPLFTLWLHTFDKKRKVLVIRLKCLQLKENRQCVESVSGCCHWHPPDGKCRNMELWPLFSQRAAHRELTQHRKCCMPGFCTNIFPCM